MLEGCMGMIGVSGVWRMELGGRKGGFDVRWIKIKCG